MVYLSEFNNKRSPIFTIFQMDEQIQLFLKSASPNEIKPFLNSLMCKNYNSFEHFTNFLEQCQPKLSCTANWVTRTMAARCKNCGLFHNSCICIPCLLDGNHIQENHQIYIYYGSSGSCDCGQPEVWDEKGFCKKHHKQCGHPEEQLPTELITHLTLIFEALKKFITQEIESKTFHFFKEIFEYIIEISKLGSGVLRLASLSFGEEEFFQIILENSIYFSSKEADIIKSFISAYVTDESFAKQFGKSLFPMCKYFYKKCLDSSHVQLDVSNEAPIIGPATILSLIYHVFIQLGNGECGMNFNTFYNEIIPILFEFIKSNPTLYEGKNGYRFFTIFWCVKIITQYYIKHEMKEELKQLFINIASSFAQIEGYIQPIQIIDALDEDSSYYHYRLCYDFIYELNSLPFVLAKNLEYVPEIIEIFVHFLFTNDDIDHPSFLFLLHKLAISTLKNAKNAKDELDKIIRKDELFSVYDEKIKNKEEGFEMYKNVYELIYFRACMIPLNIISLSMISDFDLISQSSYPSSYLEAIEQYQYSYFVHTDLPFFLSLIQFMLSFSEDKNQFLRLIESKFNIFDPQNSKSKHERMFCFILIISHFIFNDPKLIGKKKWIIQLIFMSILKNDPNISEENLNFYSGPTELNRALKWNKEVKFENNWHIVIPFVSPNYFLNNILHYILKDISKHSKKNNSVLLPFPEFSDSEIIDLRSIMKSTYLYAILYDILYEVREPILTHYALNLFILFYNNEQPKNEQLKNRQINALTLDDIVSQIPSNFIEFCEVKINYKRGGSYLSFIDLVENSGPIGTNALNRTLHKKSKEEMRRLMKLKSNIKTIKENIISKYKENALNFNYLTVLNLATDMKIKLNEKMYIFIDLSLSVIPDFLEAQCHFNFPIKKENDEDETEEEIKEKHIYSFMKKRTNWKRCIIPNTCGHFSNVVSQNYCPYCNTLFNFFVPNFVAASDPDLYSGCINSFIKIFNDMKLWIKLLKNMIIILDFRSRLKPEVIQEEMTFLIYRNIFILIKKISPHINPSLFVNRKSKLGIFLHDFIFTNENETMDFTENFHLNYVQKLHYKIDYEFLKRVELIRLFFINNKLEKIIDIDDHFNFRNLINKYHISDDIIEPTRYTKYQFYESIHDVDKSNEIEKIKVDFEIDEEQLPAFRGIDLPNNFLEIINEPFKIKMELRRGEEKFICLATGDIINRKYSRRGIPVPKQLTYQPVLIADGLRANAIGIWRPNYFVRRSSIYRTRKGDENVGFTNGDPVFLDHERYITLIDEFISGKCTTNFQNEKPEVI